jgi:hypothetical protein
MSLELLTGVFGSCGDPSWIDNNSAVELVVKTNPIAFDTLRLLEADEVYAENLNSPSDSKIQAAYDSGSAGELVPNSTFRLKLPRIIHKSVVAKNLADLLSINTATHTEPKSYFLVKAEDSGASFCFTGQASLVNATPLVRNYHEALKLWELIENRADYRLQATRHLFFFGVRKTEIAPSFSVKDLGEPIALEAIHKFVSNTDRAETRGEIFQSALSRFLKDQKSDQAFSYLLRKSDIFAKRLKEGLAIFLSEHSPEKLAQEAQEKYLEFVEKLEKVVSGIGAKSLTIPAAVLFAVKEAEFGQKWTTLNSIILISTVLYLATMFVVFLSQRAILKVLEKTIIKTKIDLKEQGLDEANEILGDSFAKLEIRRFRTEFAAWCMFLLSFIPLLAVLYAVFCACLPEASTYTIKLSPTNSVQVIQNAGSQSLIVSGTNSATGNP